MSKWSRVKFVQHEDHPWTGDVYLDDRKIDNVVALEFRHEAGGIPKVFLELNGVYDIDELVDLDIDISSESVTDAMKCIALTRQLDSAFEQKLLDRIYSALIDSRDEKCLYEKASSILDYLLEDY